MVMVMKLTMTLVMLHVFLFCFNKQCQTIWLITEYLWSVIQRLGRDPAVGHKFYGGAGWGRIALCLTGVYESCLLSWDVKVCDF